jgi:hypothetical protein
MKNFLLILIFTFGFQLLAKGEDIRDFQIEGISIGDSALNYFTKDELEKRKEIGFVYDDKTFYSATYYNKNFFNFYEAVQLHIKANDPEYKIYSLAGRIYFENNYDNCVNQMHVVLDELKDMFNNAKFVDGGIDTWNNHNGKKVKTKSYYLQLITGDEISIECYDQPKSSTIIDNLNIAIDSFEFAKWLHNK